jgi:hypothetical protein
LSDAITKTESQSSLSVAEPFMKMRVEVVISAILEKEYVMNGLIYLVGLVVVVGVVLSFLGLR